MAALQYSPLPVLCLTQASPRFIAIPRSGARTQMSSVLLAGKKNTLRLRSHFYHSGLVLGSAWPSKRRLWRLRILFRGCCKSLATSGARMSYRIKPKSLSLPRVPMGVSCRSPQQGSSAVKAGSVQQYQHIKGRSIAVTQAESGR